MILGKFLVLLVLPVVILMSAFYYFLGGTVVSNGITTGNLRNLFEQQSTVFTEPITSLGIVGKPLSSVQCVEDHHSLWVTYFSCEDFYSYPSNKAPISRAAEASFETNASKFDQLLRQNGWISRSQESVATIAASNPYLPMNGGVGGEVPFHKTVGPISCDLEITFSSLSGGLDPGSINVDHFDCQQTIRIFMPHLFNFGDS